MFKRKATSIAVLIVMGGALATPVVAQEKLERIEITGSRIKKVDLTATSPILTITEAELKANQDVTLDTFLNSLPQINPAGTTTSNNPGNGGQANIDLRGLGSNRNLILIDGRRPMVSASDQTVDLNTIPMALVESIEVITGGAGAVYGADAIGGVVNIKLKRRFQGLDLRAGISNTTKQKDAEEKNASITLGGNFADNRGNAVLSFEFAKREGLIKGQRPFAAVATSTTSFWPEGRYIAGSTNQPSQAAVDALYNGYAGTPAGLITRGSAHSFNTDGTLFYPGVFNNKNLDVINWRYPVDMGVNTKLFPDVYSYNFDAVNILTLPLERRSMMGRMDFKVTDKTEVFARFGYTRYESATALAPTPVPTIEVKAPNVAKSNEGSSALVTPGRSALRNLVIPVTNPFIPKDLAVLLASRTGDDPNLVGSGASEAFLFTWRTVPVGLRQNKFTNEVSQGLIGAKGELWSDAWTWEAYLSEGRTKITNDVTGNVDTNKLLNALAAADGGKSLCDGGINPFGRQSMSASCQAYLAAPGGQQTTFDQSIGQAFISGELAQLSAGPLALVGGLEFRNFKYNFDPGAGSGPISGFNVQSPAGGKNSFKDVFGELQIPLLSRAPMAKSLDLSLAARHSTAKATDTLNNLDTPSQSSNAFSLNLTWVPSDDLRARMSLQKAVRAPNFGELFDGSGSAPQIFDPCSASSVARTTGADAAKLAALCQATGVSASNLATYAQLPGSQLGINQAGNINLKPEKGNSVTVGLVWVPTDGMFKGFSGSIDYYSFDVKDAILTPDSNQLIASCYNYDGSNAQYSKDHPACKGIGRSGADIGVLENGYAADGLFANSNEGRIKTSGIDLALGWSDRVGPGRLDLGANLNFLLKHERKAASYLQSKSYEGTVAYFGSGLGQSFPKTRGIFNIRYKLGDVSVDSRIRYIGSMKNRMALNFPGEVFTGVPDVTYVDLGATWEFRKGMSVRMGLNNAFDKKPPVYAPNVQSGTDPSTYDVIGRRLFAQMQFTFN
ncbi:TonB-dependent receptor [Roseateles sp. DAIF2]|uniref:TonB-dependent receptor domain-containing protein n=1 Tax=Roseateles sp. DAIF2 TaxID=2714952 RepID=UPI0018A28FC3|nr:TonB-dependent receptor [Roseateles sp. DAIF2]QPF76002.1 TonB-dependent receptor [Roseateles sp. DAIF2]